MNLHRHASIESEEFRECGRRRVRGGGGGGGCGGWKGGTRLGQVVVVEVGCGGLWWLIDGG
jgi:hypothetical protein